MKFISLIILTFSLSSFAKNSTQKLAHTHREHGAHNHGSGQLGIAFDHLKGQIDMKISGDSIVGFEYTPKTDKDKKTKETQLNKLSQNISEIIKFDASISCQITKNKVEVVKDEKESAETHAEHSDVEALFDVTCAKSPLESRIVFNFQKFFPRIQDIDVQLIVDDLQKSVEARKNGTSVELKQ